MWIVGRPPGFPCFFSSRAGAPVPDTSGLPPQQASKNSRQKAINDRSRWTVARENNTTRSILHDQIPIIAGGAHDEARVANIGIRIAIGMKTTKHRLGDEIKPPSCDNLAVWLQARRRPITARRWRNDNDGLPAVKTWVGSAIAVKPHDETALG